MYLYDGLPRPSKLPGRPWKAILQWGHQLLPAASVSRQFSKRFAPACFKDECGHAHFLSTTSAVSEILVLGLGRDGGRGQLLFWLVAH